MAKRDEAKLQSQCVAWFRLQYPEIGILLFAVPNGGSRNVIEATHLKKQGVTRGVADLILLKKKGEFSSLCIEMKVGVGRQSKEQKEWQKIVEENGNMYVVCRSFESFTDLINNYLNGK